MPRISKELKSYYDRFLNWHYYGKRFNGHPIVEVNIATLNFWNEKDGLSGKEKNRRVKKYWGSGEWKNDVPEDRISFATPLSQTKISQFHDGGEPVYGVNDPLAPIHNLLLDFDDKDKLFGDTAEACRYVANKYLCGVDHVFIQESTSGSGTHGHFLLDVENVDPVKELKPALKQFADLVRADLVKQGFKCAEAFDFIKFQAPVIEWKKSAAKNWHHKPYYLKIVTGGILGRLPILNTPEKEQSFINRRIIKWESFLSIIAKTRNPVIDVKMADNTVPAVKQPTVSTLAPLPLSTGDLDTMFRDSKKQRVTLATCFLFERQYQRKATEADFETLNAIYSTSPTATGTALTPKRIERFTEALRYSQDRKPTCKALFPLSDLQEVSKRLAGLISDDLLQRINHDLKTQKQRMISIEDIGHVYLYMRHNYLKQNGQVPFDSLVGFIQAGMKSGGKRISGHAIGRIKKLLIDLKLIAIDEGPSCERHQCTIFKDLVDLLEPEAVVYSFAEALKQQTASQSPLHPTMQPERFLRPSRTF